MPLFAEVVFIKEDVEPHATMFNYTPIVLWMVATLVVATVAGGGGYEERPYYHPIVQQHHGGYYEAGFRDTYVGSTHSGFSANIHKPSLERGIA